MASALDWWRDAGVETLVDDAPRDWLARPAARADAAVAPHVAIAAPSEVLPGTLADFLAWRLSDAAPEASWDAPRIGPSGPADAALVVLTDMPEKEDRDALMSGPAGRMLDRMLAAAGLSRESVHLVSLAVARPLTGMIPADDQPRLVRLARHHLGLLRPARLLLLGKAAASVLAEDAGSASSNAIHDINSFGRDTMAVASLHPRFLLERPTAKSEAWKHLLLLTRGVPE